ncbi:hypothetical protein CPT_Shady_077 [Streptomyces phage Shady]|uniref:Peptidase C1A papain C-terminal domain-containing protein n=1 Tax=Streptomyces phage Shady TaxID=2767585 RepID=A0A873WLH1_9CAUD|nr:hypothetical protein CPT_Shady_077 [Streptomyces phage Shady]
MPVWQRRIPVHTQGRTGSCTGNALAGVLGSDSRDRTGTTHVRVRADRFGIFPAGSYALDEDFARRAYALATRFDNYRGEYPARDTGSNGLAAAQAGKALGVVADYSHVRSLSGLLAGLENGPVIWGTLWRRSMFSVDASGFVSVDRSSPVWGGHALVISGHEGDAFTIQNSWGPNWGLGGSAFVHGADMAWLLAEYADITIPFLY